MTKGRTAPTSIGGNAIGPVGFGMLGLTVPWAPIEYPVAIKVMKTALEQGANFWNGGIFYGTPEANSLHLLKYYFEKYPEDAGKVVLSIKGAFDMKEGPDGSPEGIRASVEDAIKVLPPAVKSIDIFQCARVDPNVQIETSVQELAQLVQEGKIGGVGLSEANANTIRRAQAVHPIAAVEIELSLFTPDPLRNGIAETCHELQIPIAAYSPVSRGLLTGSLRAPSDLSSNDFRLRYPRFQPQNLSQNVKLVEAVEQIAERKQVSLAQVAISWVYAQGAIPIPGSTKAERVEENCKLVELSEDELEELGGILEKFPVGGGRYGEVQQRFLNG
ncbi:MAG: Pyridoxine 4-dehydrogenase [Heterodermia speciosa]|uniref:Pyridoxine 4-dehydrogenase n=1 Tax=Heterodermia speciosa TaxID=116794 RepID=A0A8H3ILQ1_9LECA|nr:MAG: Pyridoxine 4-dehydrogenase [Heterodermia speciosa]